MEPRLLSSGSLVSEIRDEFEELWAEADPLVDVLAAYRSMLAEKQAVLRDQKVVEFDQVRLEPNAMQLCFVHNLAEIIRRGATRALLISATGTGKTYASTAGVLDKSFVNAPGDKASYSTFDLVEFDGDRIECTAGLSGMMRHDEFRKALFDLIDFGLARYEERYSASDHGLTLYEKYTRKDACRLLNW